MFDLNNIIFKVYQIICFFKDPSVGKHLVFKSCFYSPKSVSVIYLY